MQRLLISAAHHSRSSVAAQQLIRDVGARPASLIERVALAR
ncbi:hypothetical protein BLAT2472_110080 [Burkholderia latens]